MRSTPILTPIFLLLGSLLTIAQPGSVDFSFNVGEGANASVHCLDLMTNGQILFAGGFSLFDGEYRGRVARLHSDGSLDQSFDPGAGPDNDVYAVGIQSANKPVIAGAFTTVNGISSQRIARLRADGSMDITFNVGSGVNSTAVAIEVLPNDKILVAGYFSSIDGTNRSRIARLNADGSLDLTFDTGAGPNDGVRAIAVQTDSKIVIAGEFTSVNGTNRLYVARLNSDGSLDDTFVPPTVVAGPNPKMHAVVVDATQRPIIGGNFVSLDGYTRYGIARLNADGSLDTTFKPNVSISTITVTELALQPDGKILLGDNYTGKVRRLNTDGTVDTSFNIGTGPNNTPLALSIQSDGKPILVGNFTSFNGIPVNRVVRLNSDTSTADPEFLGAAKYVGAYLSGTVSNTYRIEYTSEFTTNTFWNPLFDVELDTSPQFILDPNPATGPARYYRAILLSE